MSIGKDISKVNLIGPLRVMWNMFVLPQTVFVCLSVCLSVTNYFSLCVCVSVCLLLFVCFFLGGGGGKDTIYPLIFLARGYHGILDLTWQLPLQITTYLNIEMWYEPFVASVFGLCCNNIIGSSSLKLATQTSYLLITNVNLINEWIKRGEKKEKREAQLH